MGHFRHFRAFRPRPHYGWAGKTDSTVAKTCGRVSELSAIIGNRQPATGNRQTGNRQTGNRQPATGNRQPATGNRQPATGNREPGTENQA
jgi:hypothetical protein